MQSVTEGRLTPGHYRSRVHFLPQASMPNLCRAFVACAFRWVLCVVAFATSAADKPAAVNDLHADKARFISKMETDVQKLRAEIEALRANEDARIRAMVEAAAIYSARQLRALERLLRTIRNTAPEKLPDLLVGEFLTCTEKPCDVEVRDLVVTFGDSAVQELLVRLPLSTQRQKEASLDLLLHTRPRRCPIATLDQMLLDPAPRVGMAALNTLRLNCEPAAYIARLEQMLARESDPERLVAFLDQASRSPEHKAYANNQLILMAQSRRIAPDLALRQLCPDRTGAIDFDAGRLDAPFWVEVFGDKNQLYKGCVIERFLLRLTSAHQLEQMRDVFRSAAAYRYHFGATASGGMARRRSTPEVSHWREVRGADDKFLERVRTELSPSAMRAWLAAPDTSLGERLLLSRWLGIAASALPKKWLLRVTVSTEASSGGETVATGEQVVSLGQPFALAISPTTTALSAIPHRGTATLDLESLQFEVKNFHVELWPGGGAQYDAIFPIGGRHSQSLLVKQKAFVWTIELIPG